MRFSLKRSQFTEQMDGESREGEVILNRDQCSFHPLSGAARTALSAHLKQI